jgi:hypothetical protein
MHCVYYVMFLKSTLPSLPHKNMGLLLNAEWQHIRLIHKYTITKTNLMKETIYLW